MHQLAQSFAEYFETVPANTPTLMNEVFKLRYEVFCAGRCFDPAQYPDGLERDAYDASAAHSLLIHRLSGQCAGTLRVIMAPPDREDWRFYTENITGKHFFPSFSPESIPRNALGEISRFCLSPRFRTRQDEQRWPDGLPETADTPSLPNERRTFAHPVLGLIVAAVRMSWEHGLLYWYAAMEPRLVRRLKQFGLVFEPISETFEYCGSRRAYLTYLPQMLRGIHTTHPDVWELLTDGGAIAFSPNDPSQAISRRNGQIAP